MIGNAPAKRFDYAAIHRPPVLSAGRYNYPAHAEVGPLVAAKVARLLAALVGLGDHDSESGALFAVPLDGGVIALFCEEQTNADDPNAGLVGWLQHIDGSAWSFAGYVRSPTQSYDDTVQASGCVD